MVVNLQQERYTTYHFRRLSFYLIHLCDVPKTLTYLLTHSLIHSMQHSPSCEANQFSASQKIPRILRNSQVHSGIHKCLTPVPILNQLDPVHIPKSHFLKIHLNITLPSMPGSPKWSLSLWFSNQNPVYASPLPDMCYMSKKI